MFSAEVVIAAALLLGPKEITAPESLVAAVRPQIMSLAIKLEIIDQREVPTWGNDLHTLQDRYAVMRDLPWMDEVNRFPQLELIKEAMELNRQYRCYLSQRLAIDAVHEADIRQAISENDQLRHIWDTLSDARSPYYYLTVKRESLRVLRELIGPERFYSGNLGPPIPLRHLPRR